MPKSFVPSSRMAVIVLRTLFVGALCVVLDTTALAVVGGDPVPPGAYPFQVALLKTDAYGDGAYPIDEPLRASACAGTLIGGSWVLTAAHCVVSRPYDAEEPDPQGFPPANCLPEATGDICVYRNEAFVVLAGTQELLPGRGRRFGVKQIIVHDGYREAYDNEHDIALIELDEPVRLPDNVLIADAAFVAHAQEDRRLARAVGWGLVDETYGPNSVLLNGIDIPVQPLEECRERHRLYEAWVVKERSWKDLEERSAVTEDMICTGWDAPPAEDYDEDVLPNVCMGDSGGFIGLKDGDDRWVQIGIPSSLWDCETPYIYSVHTNVAAYRDWIASKTGLSLPKPVLP